MTQDTDSKGGWTLVMEDQWPFDLCVIAQDGREIVYVRRCAHASGQKTLEDVRDAVGFPHRERPEIAALIKRQEDEARLIAAAPALLEALRSLEDALAFYESPGAPEFEGACPTIRINAEDLANMLLVARAAITQAEGVGQ